MTNTVTGPNAAETINAAVEQLTLRRDSYLLLPLIKESDAVIVELDQIIEGLKSLKVAEWRPISELPEEWKDGKTKFDVCEDGYRFADCYFSVSKQRVCISGHLPLTEPSHFLSVQIPPLPEVVG